MKNKEFQVVCYEKVHAGLINQADGTWKPATGHQMDLDMQAGHKLAGRIKRAKKQKVKEA